MDYDDNDAQDQNLHLVGEASDKVSPAYNIPKFDFDDSLQGHLRFDNLVDNDVFLGITGQDDNQWIEEYSRGTSAIQFSSSAVEIKSKNVWSEATSSESVEMLLKSVGQEDKVLEETIVEELDACDRPNSDMDPSLKQCDTKDHSINTDNALVPDESHENSVASKMSSDCEQSQETQNSGGGLDSVVIGSKYDSSLGVEEVDNLQNDANLDAGTIANESLVIEVQEEPSVSNAECGDAGSSDNLVASVKECEENRQEVLESGSENAGGQSKDVDNNMENNVENLTISRTVVETCTYSIDQVSVVSNVESLDKPSDTIHVDEEPIVPLPSESSDMQIDEGPGKENDVNMEELPAASPNSGCVEMQATEDADRKSEIPDEGPDKELNDDMQEESLASPNSGCVDVQATDHANTNDNMQEELLPASLNSGCVDMQATEDANKRSEMPDSPISNVASHVQSHSIETENVVGGDGQNVTSGISLVDGSAIINVGIAGSSAEMPAGDSSNNASKVQTEETHNVSSHVQRHSVETENIVGGDGQNVASDTSLVEGSDINNVSTTSIVAGSSAEMPVEDLLINASKVQTEDTSNVGSHAQSHSLETENVVGGDGQNATSGTSLVDGSDTNNVDTTSIVAGSSAEMPAEDLSKNASKVQTANVVGLDGEHVTSGTSLVEGSDVNNVGTTTIAAGTSAERSVEDMSNDASEVKTKGTNNEDLSLPAKVFGLVEVDDEIHSSEPDGVAMDQDVTLNEGRDAKLRSDFRDTYMDDAAAPDSQKDVEAQESDSNMAVITDAVTAAKSSKISSSYTAGGVQTLTGIAATDDNTEDQPRSPILGVSLLHTDNKEKVEAGLSNDGSSKKVTPEADSTADLALDDPLPVAEKGAESDGAERVVHELPGHCDPPVEKLNASIREQTAEEPPVENLNLSSREQTSEDDPGALKCSNAMETTLPCDSSVEHGNKEEGGLLDPKELKSSEDGVESLGANVSDEQQVSVDIAVPSACDTNHVVQNGGGSLLDKPRSLSSELPQSAKDTIVVSKGTINENAPLTTESNDKMDLQSVSSSVATTEEKSFTFEVSASPVPGQTGAQNIGLSKVSSANLHKDSLVSPQTPSTAANEAGAKGKSVPKPRRKSAARETAKKDNHLKEKTPRRRAGAVDKSPAGHVIRIEETKESVKSSSSKSAGAPISTSNLPDLNNLTSQFQQSFTDNQQVQLRAQILVYGSLISGMAPEESHMLAAFGKSDGKKAWEAAWLACLERVRGQKSQTPNPSTPMKSPSGNRDPVGSAQNKIVSGISSAIVSPMIPISSPLWNISTPGDYRQTPSPLHPYRTPPVQNVAGNNTAWLSQGPFPGQWVAASPIAPFSARFSALPITEAIKLTTVKESGASGTSVIPVDPSPGPLVSTSQPSSDSKSRKRKKVTASQAQVTPPSAPVAHLLQAPHTEDHNKNLFLAQSQTNLGTALVVSNHSPTSAAALSTPVSIIAKSTLGHPSGIDQGVEKMVRREENVSKIEESKLQAADAALQAADAVSHCQGVWSQLERQKNSGLVSDDEAKLASSAVSIAAAASVAKVAAAAARIASNVAEQARLMADEVFLSRRIESHGQSGMISHDKAMSTDHPSSIISAAREAARRRIEAASAASKHAENLDAIVKAAELAAEAVSQAGKIVAMGNPISLKALVEAGPEGYWKSPQSSNQQSSDKQIVEVASNNKEHQSLKHGSTLQEDSGDLAKSQMMIIDSISGSTTSGKNDKSTASHQKGPELAKTVALVPEPESGSVRTSDVDQNMPQSTSSKENVIKEGCLVEVYKNDHKNNGAWFAANVLALKNGKAFVCYTEIQSDQGQYKEWVPLEVDNTQAPRIRIAHPLTTMRPEGTRKRGRTALADSWFSGDRVDVWVQNRWCEVVVVETNKIDLTSLTVKFPANGETSIVRSWHVRPTQVWKDGKWIEWSSLKGCRSSEDDAPLEKRQKFGSPIVEGKEDTFSISVDLVGPRQQESQILPFATQESSFDIGKSSRNEDKLDTRGAMKSSLKKERSRVVFGVPKPGKKQKFMDVRTQYVADGSTKNNTPNDSVNFASSMIPQPGRRTPRSNLKDNGEEKQVEVKSRTLKPRKPPVPSLRSLAQKDRSKSSKSTSRDAISADENFPSNTEDTKGTSSSKAVYQRSNKAITTPGDRKAMKVEVKEQPSSEVEIRRSNRKIQPTSRMLEGLQSSLTVSKIPSGSHASHRSHNKVTSKGGSTPS